MLSTPLYDAGKYLVALSPSFHEAATTMIPFEIAFLIVASIASDWVSFHPKLRFMASGCCAMACSMDLTMSMFEKVSFSPRVALITCMVEFG